MAPYLWSSLLLLRIQTAKRQADPDVIMQTDKPLDLFLGNAGTAMRPLTAVLCAGQGEVRTRPGRRDVVASALVFTVSLE